jgi:hypothetical protein
MSWNEAEILAARGRILKAAHDMLAGTLSFIEGAGRTETKAALQFVVSWSFQMNPNFKVH